MRRLPLGPFNLTRFGENLAGPLISALLVLMCAAFVSLRSGAATVRGNEINLDRAVFVVSNSVTLTGFQLAVNPGEYKTLGQITVFTLIIAGSLVTWLVGGWAVTRILAMPYTDWQIVQCSFVTLALALVIGANFLIDQTADVWAAVFQSASAIGNSGLSIGALPAYMNWRTHAVLLPLSVIGGLGIPVLLDVLAGIFHRRRFHPHTSAVLFMSALVYVVALLSIFLVEWIDGSPPRTAIILGSTEALNSRSLGMSFNAFTELSRPSQWIVLLLMLIGASSAGTGGGLKTTTVYVLGRDTGRLLRGQTVDRVFGLACLWLVVYLLVTFTTAVLLIACYPQVMSDRLLFLAISAIGNVGTSQEPLTMTGSGLYILSAAMMFGRFAPLALLWWAASKGPRSDIAVG